MRERNEFSFGGVLVGLMLWVAEPDVLLSGFEITAEGIVRLPNAGTHDSRRVVTWARGAYPES